MSAQMQQQKVYEAAEKAAIEFAAVPGSVS
jgi:hypothetical protein